jgi:hypothetical protein
MSQPVETVQDVLQLLKTLDQTNSFEVYLPSLQRLVSFKQLNTEQFKKILKTIIDSPIYNTEFTTTFNSIIKDNILDSTINVGELNIFDKTLILIKTRIESISPEYTFPFNDEEKIQLKEFKVNVADVYNKFIELSPVCNTEVIKSNNCELKISLPTLETENRLEKELYSNVKLEITTPKELRDTIGETFINELTKYIMSIEVNQTIIDLKQHNFKTRIKFVEQLPTTCINGVLKFIERYKDLLKPLITHSNTGVEKDLPQDATFFNM